MGGAITAGDPARELGGVSIDSRTVAAGDLFVAIRGERFDGAAFVPAAVERGAAGVVVPRGFVAGGGHRERAAAGSAAATVVVEVDDTIAALQALANRVRRESGTKVVAITGSAGKTTTKELAGELLAARYHVIRNRGNLNNHIGLPLSLMELRQRPEIAVVELGMNHAGEISTLVRIAEPDVRVWTNVGDAHLGFFASVDAIADAKAEILEGAASDTLLVANADDPRVAVRARKFAGRVMTFGVDTDADVRATEVNDRGVEGLTARLLTPSGSAPVALPLIGRGNLSNALAATCVALEFGIGLDVITERLGNAKPASHRGEIVRLPGGVTLIDDSYNANPTATTLAVGVLAKTPAPRRIAVLGEMLELGGAAESLHEAVGRAVAASRIDVLFTVGGTVAAAMANAARAAGMTPANVKHFASSDDAAAAAVGTVRHGDLVLVKGSRGVKTDRVVERLKAERG
jgi:UDP-N-acetylmuramoyl-tripeptide--D-alanyl-D-alanine ligase